MASRKQYACTGCRLVRLKCIRNQENCERCIENKLECVPWTPSGTRKPYHRKGPRQKEAERLFAVERQQQKDQLHLSSTSMSSHLVTVEYESQLSASLLDVFFRAPSSASGGMLEALQIRHSFERAGSRLSELDSESSALAHVILALAARVSDHPLLVGGSSPTSEHLSQAIQDGVDLSLWGNRRCEACQALEKRAIERVDASGLWRKPSPTSFAVMMLLEGLSESSTASRDESRPYSRASLALLTDVIERGLSESDKQSLHAKDTPWAAVVRNAAVHAEEGKSIPLSEEHEISLAEFAPPPLAQVLAQPLGLTSIDPQYSYWVAMFSFIRHLIDTARLTAKKLTSTQAIRRGRLDLKAAHAIMSRNDDGAAFLRILDEHLSRTLSADLAIDDVMRARMQAQDGSLRITRCSQVLLLHRLLSERAAALSPGNDGTASWSVHASDVLAESSPRPLHLARDAPSNEDDLEYLAELQALLVASQGRAVQAVLEITRHLERHLDGGASLGIFSGSYDTLKRLPQWLSYVLPLATAELGGDWPELTFDTKRRMLRVSMSCLSAVSWSFSKLAEPLPWLRAELDRVESAEALYKLSRPNAPTESLSNEASEFAGCTLGELGPIAFPDFALDETAVQSESFDRALHDLSVSLGLPCSDDSPLGTTTSSAWSSKPASPLSTSTALTVDRRTSMPFTTGDVSVVTIMFSRLLQ